MLLLFISCTLFNQLKHIVLPEVPIVHLNVEDNNLSCELNEQQLDIFWLDANFNVLEKNDIFNIENRYDLVGESVYCAYSINDKQITSAPFSVANLPPHIEEQATIDTSNLENNQIHCLVKGADSTKEMLKTSYLWEWNDTVVSEVQNLNIVSEFLGETIRCTATVTDAMGLSVSSTATTTLPFAPKLIDGITKGTSILEFDQEWVFWAGESKPPTWPITKMPSSSNILPLLPPELQSSPDRWLFLQDKSNAFITEGTWWSGMFAPYSIRDEKEFDAYLPTIFKTQRKLKRKNLPPYSRTELIYTTDLKDIYFAKEFTIENPTDFAALQSELKFVFGTEVFLNGEKVISHQFPVRLSDFARPYTDIPYWIRTNIGKSDRWQRSWEGLPNLLKQGSNILSVHIKRQQKNDNPSMYFDLRLKGFPIGILKEPYLMNPTPTSLSVGWETTTKTSASVSICKTETPKECTVFQSDKETTLHIVNLSQLSPDTRYTYTIQFEKNDQKYYLPSSSFKTVPDNSDEFTFFLYGDSRALINRHTQIIDLILNDSYKDDALFVLHAGDFVNYGYAWDLWNENFFEPSSKLFRELPIIPVPGNHEQNQPYYYDYFDLPNNEAFYTFTQGPVQFFAINTNIAFSTKSEQYKWFEQELKNSKSRWKIVMFHHPPFSCAVARKPGNKRVQQYLVPLMEKYNVDLVLLGHDHLYGRTKSINGVTYVTSGGGGSGLYSEQADEYSPICIKKFHYVRFKVNRRSIFWQAIDTEGTVIDEFSLQ